MSIADLERRLDKVSDPSVGQLITRYGTNVEKLKQEAASGRIDPTKALMAKMAIDRIVAANIQPPGQGTVFQENMTPAAGLAAVPVQEEMFQETMTGATGGLVAMAAGGDVQRFQNEGAVRGGLGALSSMTEEERMLYEQTGQLPLRLQNLMGGPMMPGAESASMSTTRTSTRPVSRDPQSIISRAGELYSGIYTDQEAEKPKDRMSQLGETEKFLKAAGVDLDLASRQMGELAAEKEALKKDRKEAANMRLLEAGLAILGGTSANAFENIGKGALQGARGFADDIKALKKIERDLSNAERNLAISQNQVRMGVATMSDDKYQKDLTKYENLIDKKNERMGGLAVAIMQDDRARDVVEKQMRAQNSTIQVLRGDYFSDDPKRQQFAKSYLGISKTGELSPKLLEEQYNKLSPYEKLKLKQQGINNVQEYVNSRMNAGPQSGVQSGGNPTFSWKDLPK
jgi:hypothetical protein